MFSGVPSTKKVGAFWGQDKCNVWENKTPSVSEERLLSFFYFTKLLYTTSETILEHQYIKIIF